MFQANGSGFEEQNAMALVRPTSRTSSMRTRSPISKFVRLHHLHEDAQRLYDQVSAEASQHGTVEYTAPLCAENDSLAMFTQLPAMLRASYKNQSQTRSSKDERDGAVG